MDKNGSAVISLKYELVVSPELGETKVVDEVKPVWLKRVGIESDWSQRKPMLFKPLLVIDPPNIKN